MKSDAVLACFSAGASMGDLADLVGVERQVIEQLVREAMTARPPSAIRDPSARPVSPLPRASQDPGVTSSVNGAGRQAGRQAGKKRPRRARRSRDEIRGAALTALATQPGTISNLMARTATTNGTLLREILREAIRTKQVRQDGKVYHVVASR